ncbi:hypothetical protein ACIBP6_22460 [Nonomuraea terrae]|uniref:hypothetical protein n=1 Tax=Nonomuraea terrae TaxID=2530383 RepID=UPI00378A3AA3
MVIACVLALVLLGGGGVGAYALLSSGGETVESDDHVFPGEFMADTVDWAPSIKAAGEVRAPFGGWTNAMVHEADIAAVLTTALLEDGHAGRTYWPAGPEPVRRADGCASSARRPGGRSASSR